MCIVTYVPTKTGFILTSNRDENPNRPTLAPDYYHNSNQSLVYPKDKIAGGTWFGINLSKSKIGCILNAQQPHDEKSSKSRGVFLLHHLSRSPSNGKLASHNFQNLTPFEYLFVDHESTKTHFFVYHWDGQDIATKKIDIRNERIWSSLSLYSREKHSEIQNYFNHWLKQNQKINQNSIFDLHENHFVQPLKSKNFHPYQQKFPIQTVSITSLSVDGGCKKLIYKDLITKKSTIREFY